MILRAYDEHTPLIGKIAKVTELGVLLAKEYEELFNIGNKHIAERLNYYCRQKGKHEMWLMFIDEKPFSHNGVTWFCLKEIGKMHTGDWHWLTLDQLMTCN